MLLLTALWLSRRRDALPSPVQTVVILGCKVHADGQPSIALQRRIEGGAQLFHRGLGREILVTGGSVGSAPNEAEAMCAALRSLGVPQSAIRLEDKAQNTWDNARYSAAMLSDSATVVTDDWHLPRALHLFQRAGVQAQGYGVRGERVWRWRCISREILGYWLTRLRTWRRPQTG